MGLCRRLVGSSISYSNKLWLLDNYVHRLVQTKAGGKLVEVSGSAEEVSVQVSTSVVGINWNYVVAR